MLRAGAVSVQHLVVQLGAIALMHGKPILRVACIQLPGHKAVPTHLGQNGGRSDAGTLAVAPYHQLMRRGDSRTTTLITVAVNEGYLGPNVQGIDGLLHRLHSGA